MRLAGAEEGLILLVDSREGGGPSNHLLTICRALDSNGVLCETRCLPTGMGDYAWVRRTRDGREAGVPCCIERKELHDLASSLEDGRWGHQSQAMVQLWHERVGWDKARLIYMIEGIWPPREHPCSCAVPCGVSGVSRCGGPSVADVVKAVAQRRQDSRFQVTHTGGIAASIHRLVEIHRELQASSRGIAPPRETQESFSYQDIALLANAGPSKQRQRRAARVPSLILEAAAALSRAPEPKIPEQRGPPSIATVPLRPAVAARSSCSTVSQEQRSVKDYFRPQKRRAAGSSGGGEASSGGGDPSPAVKRARPAAALADRRALYHRLGMGSWGAEPACYRDLEYKPRPRSGNWALLIILHRLEEEARSSKDSGAAGCSRLSKEQMQRELQGDFDSSPAGRALCDKDPSESGKGRTGYGLGAGYDVLTGVTKLCKVDPRKDQVVLNLTLTPTPTLTLTLTLIGHSEAEWEARLDGG